MPTQEEQRSIVDIAATNKVQNINYINASNQLLSFTSSNCFREEEKVKQAKRNK